MKRNSRVVRIKHHESSGKSLDVATEREKTKRVKIITGAVVGSILFIMVFSYLMVIASV